MIYKNYICYRFLPNGTNELKLKLEKFIHCLNNLEFGAFGEFDVIVNETLDELDHINITDLYQEVQFYVS